MEYYLNVYCPAAMTMGYISSYHGNMMLIEICKECNNKIYKDLLYRIHGCICVAHRNYGMLWSGIYLVILAKSAKLTSYTNSRHGICRLYNSKTL